jgi:hypothetical protein
VQILSQIWCSVLVVLSFFFKTAALAAEEGVLEAAAAAGKLRCWWRWRDRGRWRGGRREGRAKGDDSALFLVLASRWLEKGTAEGERWQGSGAAGPSARTGGAEGYGWLGEGNLVRGWSGRGKSINGCLPLAGFESKTKGRGRWLVYVKQGRETGGATREKEKVFFLAGGGCVRLLGWVGRKS